MNLVLKTYETSSIHVLS